DDKVKKDSASKIKDSLTKANWQPDLKRIDDRKIRLTNASVSLGSFIINPAGDKLWYTATNERSVELWQVDLRTRESKVLNKFGAFANI
ncbi:hypothetical protein ACSIJM_23975, partial [Vibrio parahaemolyticus]